MSEYNDFYIDEDGNIKPINSEERKKRLYANGDGKNAGKPQGTKKDNAFTSLFNRLVEWVSESTLNLVLAIAAAVAVLVIIAALISLGVADREEIGETQVNEKDYVETLTDIDKSEYLGVLLDKSKDGGSAYIKETLFIGDSNYARLPLYEILTLDNVIGIESMGIETVLTQECVYFEGQDNPVTIPEAVSLMKPRRIVICFGTNNISDDDVEGFIKEYKKVIQELKKAYQYSDIIISAIPPLGEMRTNKALTTAIIDEYNVALLALAKECSLTYLNTPEALKATDGYMKSDYISTDGIHYSKAGLEVMLGYVRTHIHDVKDARPTPLGKVAKRKSPPVIVTEDKELNLEKVISFTEKIFTDKGHQLVETMDNNTPYKTVITYSIPIETEPGKEQQVADWFYSYILKALPIKTAFEGHGYKTLKVLFGKETTVTEYKFYAAVVPVYCTGEHTLVEDKDKTVEATCQVKGKLVEVCSVCGYIQTTETDKLEHVFDSEKTQRVEPTCTEEGTLNQYCTVCEKVIATPIEKLGHNYVVSGDCTTGLTYTCNREGCDSTQPEHSYTVAAGEHTWGEWVYDNVNRTRTCTVCGTTESEKHEYVDTVVAPTAEADGYTEHKCSLCGHSYQDTVVPKLTTSP